MGGVPTALVLYAEPTGYYQPYTWIFPQISGELGSSKFISGAASISNSNLAGGLNAEAPLVGSGDFSATGQLIVSMVSALVGSGEVSGSTIAFFNIAADLAGAGDLAGSAKALGNAVGSLSGAGDTAATVSAIGALLSDLIVTGDLLNTANIADAVLDALNGVEQNLTVREALRLIAAATAGKVSGAGTTTVTFRSAEADDKDRIIATVDSSGNRTAIVTDLE